MGASCVRWTVDTERAFLLALRVEGEVVRAAAAIGRGPSICYQRRERRPAFAAAWDRVVADMAAARLEDAAAARAAGEEPARPLTRARRDGWTQQRRRAFGRALADTGSYGQAAARVGISLTSVRRLRRRSGEFQALCDRALTEGGVGPAEAAYVRAVEGWEEPVYQGGRLVGHRRRYSDALLRDLLRTERGASAQEVKQARWQQPADADSVRADILRKVAAVRTANDRERAQAQLAWCERLEREGKAP